MLNYKTITDEQLVSVVRTKDKEAYSEIIKRYEHKLIRYITYLIGDKDKAVDIVQNTFIKVFINLNSFNLKKKFSSWIYRIAHNEGVNIIKKNKMQVQWNEDFDYAENINLEDSLIQKELKLKANYCLNKMPLIYREPLSLFFLEEKSYEEITDILRIPMGTVGTRINRAKILMKKICQNQKK